MRGLQEQGGPGVGTTMETLLKTFLACCFSFRQTWKRLSNVLLQRQQCGEQREEMCEEVEEQK